MPLEELIYMPEESTPTIATPGNREAVAYLELSEHTDYYGRLFANAPKVLHKLLDIKRLAESGDDNGYEPYALLELIAQEARAALAFTGPASVRYTVGSSHGELSLDAEGNVLARRLDNDDSDGGGHLARIVRFDIAEWLAYWEKPEASAIDILDLGYWFTDPKTGKSVYEPPSAKWRLEIAEILLDRRRAANGTAEGNSRFITVSVKGGLVQEVTGLPPGCELRVEDYDVQNPGDDSWDTEKECVVIVYEGGAT